MSAIASRPRLADFAWGAFAFANGVGMVVWPRLETIPFHFIWVSLTILYGFRVWAPRQTLLVLGGVALSTANLIAYDVSGGAQDWSEVSEVPLMSAMFLAMVWHARRRQQALQEVEAIAERNATLLQRQEAFLHDVSHELRTPVTIARGHLELMRGDNRDSHDLDVAVDELGRIERIISRLLLLAKAERPDFLRVARIDVESFLEDVFARWSDVTPRGWRLGAIAGGVLTADEEALRTALDALVENAVKYTEPANWIELRAKGEGGELVIEVRDGGIGVPSEALDHIFDRFARADGARTREAGGAGLGLAIVSAIAQAHGGRCTAAPLPRGTVFALRLPGFVPATLTADVTVL
jgi:two-component system, OmpR family, sensor kinase